MFSDFSWTKKIVVMMKNWDHGDHDDETWDNHGSTCRLFFYRPWVIRMNARLGTCTGVI